MGLQIEFLTTQSNKHGKDIIFSSLEIKLTAVTFKANFLSHIGHGKDIDFMTMGLQIEFLN